MTKYNLDIKRKYIELIESNKHSIRTAAKELGVSRSVGHRWWQMYQTHGYEGLSMDPKKYTGEFKIHVVKYMHENHLSLAEASAMFVIPGSTTLAKWECIYNAEGESGLLLKRCGRLRKSDMKIEKAIEENSNNNKTNDDLMLEVARLRAEVDYLKKAIALKEEKKSLQTKKRQR